MQILFAEIVLSWLLLIIMFLLPEILELFSRYQINNAVTFIHFSMLLCLVRHESVCFSGYAWYCYLCTHIILFVYSLQILIKIYNATVKWIFVWANWDGQVLEGTISEELRLFVKNIRLPKQGSPWQPGCFAGKNCLSLKSVLEPGTATQESQHPPLVTFPSPLVPFLGHFLKIFYFRESVAPKPVTSLLSNLGRFPLQTLKITK